jgi:hypothetical protein
MKTDSKVVYLKDIIDHGALSHPYVATTNISELNRTFAGASDIDASYLLLTELKGWGKGQVHNLLKFPSYYSIFRINVRTKLV